MPLICFVLVLFLFMDLFLGLIIGIVVFVALFLISVLFLLKHPFLSMIEGSGNMLLTLDSTGLIRPFLLKINPPRMQTQIGNKTVSSLYDRKLLTYLVPPLIANAFSTKEKVFNEETQKEEEEEFTVIKFKKKDYPKLAFGFEGKPTFIYNSLKNTFLSKEMLAELEEKVVAHHLLLNLIAKTEELHGLLRDFVRYIVEQLRPKEQWWQNKWLWIVIIIVGGLVMLFVLLPGMPQIMQAGNNLFAGSPITPRG